VLLYIVSLLKRKSKTIGNPIGDEGMKVVVQLLMKHNHAVLKYLYASGKDSERWNIV